jgi:hypothetical protein
MSCNGEELVKSELSEVLSVDDSELSMDMVLAKRQFGPKISLHSEPESLLGLLLELVLLSDELLELELEVPESDESLDGESMSISRMVGGGSAG